MERDLIEFDFLKVKKVINSIQHGGQINTCEKLITLFIDKHFNEDFTTDEEISFDSYKKELISYLKYKKIKYGIVEDDY